MGLRMGRALLLAAVQIGLLAGCAEIPGWFGTPATSDYAMATTEPVTAPQPQALPQAAPDLPQAAQSATPPQGKFGVQIAAPRSVEEARALIDAMRAKYPGELAQQWATILPVSLPKAVFYRVLIGPLDSEQQAAQLCSRLKAQGVECFIRAT
jgi:cell division septation protein DedD